MTQLQIKIEGRKVLTVEECLGSQQEKFLHGDAGSTKYTTKETLHTSVLLPGPVGKASLGRILNTLLAIAG